MDSFEAVIDHGSPHDLGAPGLRRAFWHSFKRHLEEASTVRSSRVSTDGWMWHNADLATGRLLSILRVRLGEIGVKYMLNDADADTVFAYLLAHRAEVEGVFDVPPEWRAGGDGSNVIDVRRGVRSYDREEWPELFRWLQRQLETFHLALWPLVGRVPPRGEMRQWDEVSFMRELHAWNPTAMGPAMAILEATPAPDVSVSWGRGRHRGSFTRAIIRRGTALQLVSVRTDGTAAFLFTQLKRSPFFAPRQRRLELLEHLNRLECVSLPDSVIDLRPSLPLALLSDEAVVRQLLDVLAWFEDNARSS